MSDVRKRPIAILISDIHLSETPPRCRAGEPDWTEAQQRPLREIIRKADELEVDVICAGDIFHKWDPSPALINFALDELPFMYAVAGNHDLPYHDPDREGESAFGTLVRAGKIKRLRTGERSYVGSHPSNPGLMAYGFGYGKKITPPDDRREEIVRLAVVHAYIWHELLPDTSYPGAPPEATVGAFKTKLKGYDVALFGDNHSPFYAKCGKCIVYNHGNLIRRTVDECKRTPEYGILYSDGSIERKPLESAAEDVFEADIPDNDVDKMEEDLEAVEDFIRSINTSGEARFDYAQALERYLADNRVSDAVAKVLRRAVKRKERK